MSEQTEIMHLSGDSGNTGYSYAEELGKKWAAFEVIRSNFEVVFKGEVYGNTKKELAQKIKTMLEENGLTNKYEIHVWNKKVLALVVRK